MRLVRIYITGNERITVYSPGGCQFEARVPDVGWVVDNDSCHDWKEAMDTAINAMRAARANLELVA